MTRVCTVCTHPQRAKIDAALVAGEAYRRIAPQYGLAERSIRRHVAEHLPAHLAQAQKAKEVSHADRLLSEIEKLHRLALAILTRAGQSGQLRTALAGIREARGCLELEAKIRGELSDATQVNVLLGTDWWVTFSATLLQGMDAFPEAKVAAAAALLAAEERSENGHGYVTVSSTASSDE